MATQGAQPIDLARLHNALVAAGHPIRGLGMHGTSIYTYDAQGLPIDLPAGAAAFVASYTPTPTQRDADLATVRAKANDPAWAALLRLLGLE